MALLTFCIIYSISRTVTIDLDSEKMTGYYLCEDDVEHIVQMQTLPLDFA